MASKLGYSDTGATNAKKVEKKTSHTFLSWLVPFDADSFYVRDGKPLTWAKVERDVLAVYDEYGVSHDTQEDARLHVPMVISKLQARIDELESQVKELQSKAKK